MSAKIAIVVSALALGGVSLFGFWRYATHRHAEFLDADLARRANSVCADAQSHLAERPTLPDAPSLDERAARVASLASTFEEMVTRLRALSAPGENHDFDAWIDTWHRFIEAGRGYEQAIKTGDPAVYEPAGDAGDAPALALNRIALANDMPACVF